MTEFEWPWQYQFPPFFTLQPNTETRQKQVSAWRSLILSYCRHHGVYALDVAQCAQSPLFSNVAIKRRLSEETIQTVLDDLATLGHAEWTDKAKRRCLVLWRSPAEWGQLIYGWAVDSGLVGSVCTLYELTHGDHLTDQPFHGLCEELLVRALGSLQAAGKAELMDNEGVKFF
ncbi:vacuolar protein-sorting-associated protein 25-like [Amphibalanus amphitrite]|uniref:vacuolar protein-sorting-associated protein 25-like n=1 Tax=Amphibalanus amphitrite TaxID=1232801 RepID=UPI001C8FF43F|nr:vacuolar protein-sorting-associated protein 25-like [Amphibalanus amphitrite]